MKEKNEKGITLIALVVTIVVLLILAGITINLLFSNGGIFDIANQAKIEHEIGALKDRINNVIADWSIERAVYTTVTVDDLWDKMVEADIIDNPEEDIEGPEKGHYTKVNLTPKKHLREFRVDSLENVKVGDELKADIFAAGDKLDIQGTSKGKGFQGVVKRWGIRIQYGKAVRAGKGRHVGSIGPWTPSRTMWTVAQAGQMGYHKRTEFNKKILKIASADEVDQINPDGGFVKYGLVKNDYVLVKGSLPGPSKRLVILRQPIRPNKKSEDMPQINYISTKSKQGV